MLIFDGHLDLAMNAIEWNRDYTRPLAEVRQREQGLTDKNDRGQNVLTFGEMRRGQIGLCIATQIARYVAPDNPLPGWNSPEIAWAITQGQLAWYRAMEEAGHLVQIVDRQGLNRLVALWQHDPPPDAPIGYVLSLEGADSILTPAHLERAYAYGLRAVGPAHYGPGRYSPGTAAEGGLTPLGRELLREMRRLGIVLDATHLTDQAFWEALDLFDGPVWASHHNCRALVPDDRQLSDEQIRADPARRRDRDGFRRLDDAPRLDSRSDDTRSGESEDRAHRGPHRSHLPTGGQRSALWHRFRPGRRLRPRAMPPGPGIHCRSAKDRRPAGHTRLRAGGHRSRHARKLDPAAERDLGVTRHSEARLFRKSRASLSADENLPAAASVILSFFRLP